jgi:hypothetical protein
MRVYQGLLRNSLEVAMMKIIFGLIVLAVAALVFCASAQTWSRGGRLQAIVLYGVGVMMILGVCYMGLK